MTGADSLSQSSRVSSNVSSMSSFLPWERALHTTNPIESLRKNLTKLLLSLYPKALRKCDKTIETFYTSV
jgi:hypothetical protein